MLKKRSFSSLSLTLACASPVLVAVPHLAHAQTATAASVVVRSLSGDIVKLSIGEAEGARVGAVYGLSRGSTSARLQIFEVDAAQSLARILESTPGFVITVGDTARFLGMEPLATPIRPSSSATSQLPAAPVLAVQGKNVTLGLGARDGMVPGAVYAMPMLGAESARMIVTVVRDGESTAVLQTVAEGFTPTVGEMARFVTIEELPAHLRPQPVMATAPLEVPMTPTLPTVEMGAPVVPSTLPISISGSTASVSSVEGESIVVSAGAVQSMKTGQTLPILRDGAIVGLAKVSAVRENDASAFVLWRDETAAPIAVGDAVGILAARAGTMPLAPVDEKTPAALVKYETGASNTSVPKADRTYSLLASLAATGLIQSHPPRVFHDNGARRHDTSEDIVFSRAQIAGFIREALGNYGGAENRDGAALAILTKDFRKDLLDIGVPNSELERLRGKGFQIGVSTWTRATVTGGDNGEDNRDPFAERFGARRSKTGLDTRFNVFSTLSNDLELYGSGDLGTKIREGADNGSEVRNLYLKYDAKRLLRGLSLEIGRKEQWWGVGQYGTTVLGDAVGGLDSLQTSFKRGSYELNGYYAYLGKGPAGGPRSLYGQNLSVRIGKSAKVGLASTLLSPKDRFDPKLFLTALSPVPLYLVDRADDDPTDIANTNAVIGAYGEVGVGKGARVYGEVVLDDFSANSNNRIENRNGSLVGVQLFNPKDPAKMGFKFEYARFNSWAYTFNPTQLGPGRDRDYEYYNDGAPLGYPIAPLFPSTFGGAESLRLEAYMRPMKRLWVNGGLEFSDINPQDQNGSGPGDRGFSRQQVYRLAVGYDLSRNWSLTGRVQRVATDQPNFIRDEESQVDKFLSLEIGRAF